MPDIRQETAYFMVSQERPPKKTSFERRGPMSILEAVIILSIRNTVSRTNIDLLGQTIWAAGNPTIWAWVDCDLHASVTAAALGIVSVLYLFWYRCPNIESRPTQIQTHTTFLRGFGTSRMGGIHGGCATINKASASVLRPDKRGGQDWRTFRVIVREATVIGLCAVDFFEASGPRASAPPNRSIWLLLHPVLKACMQSMVSREVLLAHNWERSNNLCDEDLIGGCVISIWLVPEKSFQGELDRLGSPNEASKRQAHTNTMRSFSKGISRN